MQYNLNNMYGRSSTFVVLACRIYVHGDTNAKW